MNDGQIDNCSPMQKVTTKLSILFISQGIKFNYSELSVFHYSSFNNTQLTMTYLFHQMRKKNYHIYICFIDI